MKSKNIWYKQVYVSDILSGKKDDTYRKPTDEYKVGQTLSFSVGPRKPFAFAEVVAVIDETPEQIETSRLNTLRKMYGALPFYRRVKFRVTQVC